MADLAAGRRGAPRARGRHLLEHRRVDRLRTSAAATYFPTPSIAALSFLTTASAIPLSENEPLALTTPARITATSRIRPTYSTVPCPRSRAHARTTHACALPIAS